MHHTHRTAVSRFFKLLGCLFVSAALIAPAAHAGERKKASAKKEQVSSVKSKRAVAPRKTAASRKAVRITAKTAKAPTRVAYIPPRLSFGQIAGLHEVTDPLELKSSVALV